MATREARAAWDLPTRLFHWALAGFVVFSYVTGKLGGSWMAWHMRSGYAILALVIFRIAWGFAGPPHSRFATFLATPRAVVEHGRALLARIYVPGPGHTPLGGWMTVALVAALAFQAGTGLFSNDESDHEGPLAVKVSEAIVDRLSALHSYNQWLLVALVVLHISAVLFYEWSLDADLARGMVLGESADRALWARAIVMLAGAAAFVYLLVVVYPSP